MWDYFCASGVYIFSTNDNIFFGALLTGIKLIITEGSEINLKIKTYRTIKSIFGIHLGKWKPCPKFEYISVFKTKEIIKRAIPPNSTTYTNDIILLNLFYEGNKKITVYKTYNKEDAFKVAEHLHGALDIDVLDATERESKWLW